MWLTLTGSGFAPSIVFNSCVLSTPIPLGPTQRSISSVVITNCITQQTLLHCKNIAFLILPTYFFFLLFLDIRVSDTTSSSISTRTLKSSENIHRRGQTANRVSGALHFLPQLLDVSSSGGHFHTLGLITCQNILPCEVAQVIATVE